MEHLTSTQIIEPGALGEPGVYVSTLGTVAHEFFHVWNVKRLRPAELGPWDFTRPVSTRSLWLAEGFTNYFGHLMMRRAGDLGQNAIPPSRKRNYYGDRKCTRHAPDER